MITPNSTIRFLNVPFSPSQINVLKFTNAAAQIAYMEAKAVYTISGCTYQREGDGEFVRVPKHMDLLYNCNYVMFQNTNFSNKWFYAFISHMEFLNNSVTKVFLKMDTYQTFQFEHTIQKSFVDRQTFATDAYNTLPDVPGTGDLKNVFQHERSLSGLYFVLFNADPTVEDCSASTARYPVLGSYSMPCYMGIFQTAALASKVIEAISNKGRADRIQAAYFAPCSASMASLTNFEVQQMPVGDLVISGLPTPGYIDCVNSIAAQYLYEDFTFNINYTATYKKELCYPYAKLEIVDRITGQSISLDVSKFADPLNPHFRIIYNITEKPYYKIVPIDYNGAAYSVENSFNVEPASELPIFSNSYAKYYKNNGVSNILNGVLSAATGVGSIVAGNPAGAIGGFADVARVINSDRVAQTQPNQVNGIAGDAIEYVNMSPSIYFRLKVMDTYHMNMARKFWYQYGYPVKSISTFSATSNRFNFYKTAGVNIDAPTIPGEYMTELESMYDNGVTVWNNSYLLYE